METRRLGPVAKLVLLLAFVAGCGEPPEDKSHAGVKVAAKAPDEKSNPDSAKASGTEAKRIEVGRNVSLEVLPTGERRVLVNAAVCFRKGPLEMFMCRKYTKEHESIISGDFDARDIHAALMLAGAVPGAPAKFEPKYVAASGTPISVSVRFTKDGKEITIDARQWIRDHDTQKEMQPNWVFTGSVLYPDPADSKKQLYAANGGDVICVSNFGTAMLDIPIESSAVNEDLRFEAWTDRIPELGAKVTVILQPAKK